MTQICDVDVWLITLERDGEIVLSPDEEVRAARFHFEYDRVRWVRAHSALRLILAQFTGTPAAAIQFSIGLQGKPAIIDSGGIEFSLSHAGSWAMVAVTRGVPVGVDIERIRENVNMVALLQRLSEPNLPDTQADLYKVWTRREAKSKAVGGALFDKPPDDLHVCDLVPPEGYSAALALIGCEPRVRFHDALRAPFDLG